MKFVFEGSVNTGEKLYPQPLPGEIARITLNECSGRDLGGCVSPDVVGLLLLKTAEGYEIRRFRFKTHRQWDMQDSWAVIRENFIDEPMKFSKMPAFIWREVFSGYHFDHDSAVAEVEVIDDPTPEQLVAEMNWDEDRKKFAEIVLADLEKLTLESLAEKEPVCPSLKGVWLERSQLDIRSLAAKRYEKRMVREFFCDPRPPVVKEEVDWFRQTKNTSYRVVYIHDRPVAKIPLSQWNTWKRAFADDHKKRRNRRS